MSEKIVVLCDTEEEYARQMTEFLQGCPETPWELLTYTDTKELQRYAAQAPVGLLVVAENAYTQEVRSLPVGRTLLLNESGVMKWSNVRNISKYQLAENVYKAILGEYMSIEDKPFPKLITDSDTKLIGFYSPVHRSMQTLIALTVGQVLAEKHRTLYLNLEFCAGSKEFLSDGQVRDITDLMYFLNTDKEKFSLRLQTMIQRKGGLEYIPPARMGVHLPGISGEEWLECLSRIKSAGGYEYILLDLGEAIQGLFPILRECSRVYTMTMEDKSAQEKLAQYEQMLHGCDFGDVWARMVKWPTPRLRKTVESVEELGHGPLAETVRKMLLKDEKGEPG